METIKISSLTKEQSDKFLSFALLAGVSHFCFDYICSDDEREKKEAQQHYDALAQYKEEGLYKFTKDTVRILREMVIHGILPSMRVHILGFEDLKLYKKGTLIFEGVSHEEIGFLYLEQKDKNAFSKLGISFEVCTPGATPLKKTSIIQRIRNRMYLRNSRSSK